MATLYLPEGKVPMVPTELSDEKGSLLPGDAKPALSLLVRFDELGEPVESEVVPGRVQVDTGLSYDEAAVHLGAAYWTHIAARRDGSFTVTNSRNGFSKEYPASSQSTQ